MNREEKERRARMQRMLARERGETPPPGTEPEEPAREPARPGRPAPKGGQDADPEESRRPRTGNTRPLSPILQRRRRRKRNLLIALVLVIALGFAVLTGVFSTSIAMLGDLADSVALTFEPGGWPASTGITDPLQIEELAGGFVELDSTDVAVFSSHGAKVRTIQPGYARPALAAGNTRFVLYDRTGTSVRVESRTRTLKTLTMPQAVMLCAISSNGTLGVVTQAERYVAQLQLLDAATYEPLFTWKMTREDGTPVALAFAPDNRRFAVGTVAARDGRLVSKVSLSRIAGKDAPLTYTADAGSMILQLQWLPGGRLLAVLDTCAVLIDPDTGTELARYDFAGRELLGVSVSGRTAALLLGSHSGSSLVLLDAALTLLAEADAAQATAVTCTDTAAYLIENNTVACYTLDGSLRWVHAYESRPQLVLDAAQTLLFTAGRAEVLSAPE